MYPGRVHQGTTPGRVVSTKAIAAPFGRGSRQSRHRRCRCRSTSPAVAGDGNRSPDRSSFNLGRSLGAAGVIVVVVTDMKPPWARWAQGDIISAPSSSSSLRHRLAVRGLSPPAQALSKGCRRCRQPSSILLALIVWHSRLFGESTRRLVPVVLLRHRSWILGDTFRLMFSRARENINLPRVPVVTIRSWLSATAATALPPALGGGRKDLPDSDTMEVHLCSRLTQLQDGLISPSCAFPRLCAEPSNRMCRPSGTCSTFRLSAECNRPARAGLQCPPGGGHSSHPGTWRRRRALLS